jgi:hypothetical protein
MENTSIIVEVFIECVKRWRKFRSSVERTWHFSKIAAVTADSRMSH